MCRVAFILAVAVVCSTVMSRSSMAIECTVAPDGASLRVSGESSPAVMDAFLVDTDRVALGDKTASLIQTQTALVSSADRLLHWPLGGALTDIPSVAITTPYDLPVGGAFSRPILGSTLQFGAESPFDVQAGVPRSWLQSGVQSIGLPVVDMQGNTQPVLGRQFDVLPPNVELGSQLDVPMASSMWPYLQLSAQPLTQKASLLSTPQTQVEQVHAYASLRQMGPQPVEAVEEHRTMDSSQLRKQLAAAETERDDARTNVSSLNRQLAGVEIERDLAVADRDNAKKESDSLRLKLLEEGGTAERVREMAREEAAAAASTELAHLARSMRVDVAARDGNIGVDKDLTVGARSLRDTLPGINNEMDVQSVLSEVGGLSETRLDTMVATTFDDELRSLERQIIDTNARLRNASGILLQMDGVA